jgi:type II secretory pathway pseudopilin PulG
MYTNDTNLKKGFTLIETLIYVALIGGVLTTFISYMLAFINIKGKEMVINDVSYSAKMAMSIITAKIKSADSIISPGNGQASSTLIISTGGEQIRFYENANIFFIKVGQGEPIELAGHNLSFSNLLFLNSRDSDPESIKINYTVAGLGGNGFNYERDFETAVSLRK